MGTSLATAYNKWISGFAILHLNLLLKTSDTHKMLNGIQNSTFKQENE